MPPRSRAADAPDSVLITGHPCDVSDATQVNRFRDELLEQHATDHVDLVFANAGVGGGASFVDGDREEWERTFAIDWWGTYNCARTFLPLLIASGDGVLVNTSSVNGFWASLGPGMPNTAYATAKFAIKGFTEALIEDLRSNAPQVRVAVVMPGHVGTDIIANTRRAHGTPEPQDISDAGIEEMIPADARAGLIKAGLLSEHPHGGRHASADGADRERLPGQGSIDRGRRRHDHPRRGQVGHLADPRRRGREEARRDGSRQSRGRL